MNRSQAALAVLALAIRLGIASRDLAIVDRLFVPDDTYYTLSIARSLAAGAGPTIDGAVATSGFQPLLAFLMVPVFWLSTHPDAALRAVILLMAAFDALSALLLGRLAQRAGGATAGWMATLVWAVSPLAIANALGGLETSLALCASLALVLAASAARDAHAAGTSGQWRAACVGVLCGICLLARVDTVFLVGMVGALLLADRNYRGLAAAVACALAVVAPWWLYSIARFGTWIPESGPAVAQIIEIHRAIYLERSTEIAWAAGSMLGSPFVELQQFREMLAAVPWLGAVAWILTLLSFAGLAVRYLPMRGAHAPIGVLACFAAAIAVFYTFHLPAVWFFRRYFAVCHAWLTLLSAVLLVRVWQQRMLLRSAWYASALCAALGLGTSVYETSRYAWQTPSEPPDKGLHGAKGYRASAQAIWRMLPAAGVLGAFQSGALSYYAPHGWTVVNLDGVVDHNAYEATAKLTLSDYALQRGMTHFADWAFNTNVLQITSMHSHSKPKLEPLGRIRTHGRDEYFVFSVGK